MREFRKGYRLGVLHGHGDFIAYTVRLINNRVLNTTKRVKYYLKIRSFKVGMTASDAFWRSANTLCRTRFDVSQNTLFLIEFLILKMKKSVEFGVDDVAFRRNN